MGSGDHFLNANDKNRGLRGQEEMGRKKKKNQSEDCQT